MIPKLQENMNQKRIPLFLRKRNDTIYFQMQVYVAGEDGLRAETYCEYKKVQTDDAETVGKTTKIMLSRFHEISDLTLSEFQNLACMNIDS